MSAVILTMLVAELSYRVGGVSEEGRKLDGKRSTGKVGGIQAEVRVKAVNVFMEKWGLSTRPNQGPAGNFMGER